MAVCKADEVDWQVYALGLLGNCMVYIAKTPRERYKGRVLFKKVCFLSFQKLQLCQGIYESYPFSCSYPSCNACFS